MLEIGRAINWAAEWASSGEGIIARLVQNPIITSLILTVLALIVVSSCDFSTWRAALRGTAVLFGFIFIVIIIHHYVTNHKAQERGRSRQMVNTVNQILTQASGQDPPIIPSRYSD